MRARNEAGFTLLETIIAVAIVALIAGAAGTLFLAGATPAVAAANRDVVAAFDEGRRTALAFDAATVVFAPAVTGSGYSARVYQRMPGDSAFQPRNGPTFDSTVAIAETAAPLGAPGFAFTIDSHGNVAALSGYTVNGSDYVNRACPASGAFTLQLTYAHDARSVTIPCTLGASSAGTLAEETPPAAIVPTPGPAGTCPSANGCVHAGLLGPPSATCPPGLIADAATPGLCDGSVSTPTPAVPSSTCPPGFTGTPPNCVTFFSQVTPTPTPVPTALPGSVCQPGAVDANGFATCLSAELSKAGAAISHESCGTHTPIVDPGPQFETIVDVFENNAFWGSYEITIGTLRTPWFDLESGQPDCGLAYTLTFRIEAIVPIAGHAATTPSQDTGDSQIVDQGAGPIVIAPYGAPWGSNS
jgi:prepilin-type N-terminal cleavage/methylation domain-containing protein